MKKLLTVTAAMLAVALLAGPALAGKVETAVGGSAMVVDDRAGAFTADGVKKAEDAFHAVTFKVPTHYTVVTHNKETLPTDIRKDLDGAGADKEKASAVLLDFARSLYKAKRESGLLTLVYLDGDRFMVKTVTDRETDKYRSFTDADCAAASTKIGDTVRESKGKLNGKEIRDGGLMKATEFVVAQLKDTTVPDLAKKPGDAKKAAGGGLSILQWVLIIGGGLLVMWLVIGLIRALTGGGGGGGGNGGGGGGGGGFMSGMMGGLFGAMAGMYLYNSMFGGGMSNASAGGDSYGGNDGGNYDTGNGDVDGGAAGGDGDWGGGGGDAGAGGDWGGGGDAGGGGGGDFGGGGDW